MLGVDGIGEIRWAHYREGRSIRGSAGIWRIPGDDSEGFAFGATEFVYKRRTRLRPKIGPWQSELEGMLSGNASRPKHERLTLMRIFEELRSLGYEGGYESVRRHASRWAKERDAASINMTPLTLRSALWRPTAGWPKAPPNPTIRGQSVGFQRLNRQPLLGILKFWVAWTIFLPQMQRNRTTRAHGMITELTVGN